MAKQASDIYQPELPNSDLPDYLHVSGLPERFALLADAILLVEDTALPVHSTILVASSPVFAEIFLTALTSSKSGKEQRLSIPLKDETLEDVCTALMSLYYRCVNSKASSTLGDSLERAHTVLKFAHKFDMKSVLQECESSLVLAAETGTQFNLQEAETAVDWLTLAVECDLNTLMAHIELSMIKNPDPSFWSLSDDSKMSISKDSLLRIMRGIQYHASRRVPPGSTASSAHVTIPTLILWQANLNAAPDSLNATDDEDDDFGFALFDQ